MSEHVRIADMVGRQIERQGGDVERAFRLFMLSLLGVAPLSQEQQSIKSEYERRLGIEEGQDGR